MKINKNNIIDLDLTGVLVSFVKVKVKEIPYFFPSVCV